MQISRYEKGISPITSDFIAAVCEKYSVDHRYFSPSDDGVEIEDAVKVESNDQKNRAVAERLKDAREDKGWSQNELAKRSGVGQSIVTANHSRPLYRKKPR